MSISAITSLLAPDSEVVSSRCPDLDGTPIEGLAAGGYGRMGDLPPEFERLFYAVEALRAGDRPVVLQFTGVAGAEGVTTVASGFARAAAAGCRGRSKTRPLHRRRMLAPNAEGPKAKTVPST